MPRRPEIGNIQLYPNRTLQDKDKNGYTLKFFCPIRKKRVRKNCGTRDRREARRILRECQERLHSGEYVATGGAIVAGQTQKVRRPDMAETGETLSWDAARQRYREFRSARGRKSALGDSLLRIDLAYRIFDAAIPRPSDRELLVTDCMTLDRLEFLQEQLLAGTEGRKGRRSPNTVNSTMAAVMAFVRFCRKYGWIPSVPSVQKLEVDEVMKGRPVTSEEFDLMLAVTPDVVGKISAPSWQFALRVLWETGFRIGDLMDFHWTDDRHIIPLWKKNLEVFPTLMIPSSQKNRRVQEIPLLPGLIELLESVPIKNRVGWVVDPQPMEFEIRADSEWFKPDDTMLSQLAVRFSNVAIGRACGVSESSVRHWLTAAGVERTATPTERGYLSAKETRQLRTRSECRTAFTGQRKSERMTVERVGRVIGMIGKAANILVRQADPRTGTDDKYASAHDLRRGFAQRLINLGVTAETLKQLLRHASFSTTQNYYGATRSAQVAGHEVRERLNSANPALVGGLVGGLEQVQTLSPEEVSKLKLLLNRL